MAQIHVSADAVRGPLELWRHSIGHGGINPLPLPDRVVQGAAKLHPRLIRIFIQEFFRIYPQHGRFDWSLLDPYMDALARTGAQVVAAITIKPKPLYPEIDQTIWRPNDVAEWQHVIYELAHRYSVEKPLVTHWEVGNEFDCGEGGGCPYLIADPRDYAEYYEMTLQPILAAYPQAKVGGPAQGVLHQEPLPGFVKQCAQRGTQLDLLTWHLYHSDPGRHGYQTRIARLLAQELPRQPELMVTEWSCGFPAASVQDEAFETRRAASVAASILEMRQAGLHGSFYYHLWDQVCYPDDFAPFFSQPGINAMVRHWNERPHRFGLFGVNEEVRPQYFVFQMLSRLGEDELAASSDDHDVRVLAGRATGNVSVLAVNHSLDVPRDRLVTLSFADLPAGTKRLTLWRIDKERRWDADRLELLPMEQRETYTRREYECQFLLPADSVALLQLRNVVD